MTVWCLTAKGAANGSWFVTVHYLKMHYLPYLALWTEFVAKCVLIIIDEDLICCVNTFHIYSSIALIFFIHLYFVLTLR